MFPQRESGKGSSEVRACVPPSHESAGMVLATRRNRLQMRVVVGSCWGLMLSSYHRCLFPHYGTD